MNPEDRGPSSERVVKLNLANPVHAGIVKNKENNPNYKITHTEKGAVLSTAVAPGMEFEPRPSTKYPSFNTETTPYKYEPPKVKPKKPSNKKPPKKKAAIKTDAPSMETVKDAGAIYSKPRVDKEAARAAAAAKQAKIAAALKKRG